jgi:hypothetical protein
MEWWDNVRSSCEMMAKCGGCDAEVGEKLGRCLERKFRRTRQRDPDWSSLIYDHAAYSIQKYEHHIMFSRALFTNQEKKKGETAF